MQAARCQSSPSCGRRNGARRGPKPAKRKPVSCRCSVPDRDKPKQAWWQVVIVASGHGWQRRRHGQERQPRGDGSPDGQGDCQEGGSQGCRRWREQDVQRPSLCNRVLWTRRWKMHAGTASGRVPCDMRCTQLMCGEVCAMQALASHVCYSRRPSLGSWLVRGQVTSAPPQCHSVYTLASGRAQKYRGAFSVGVPELL